MCRNKNLCARSFALPQHLALYVFKRVDMSLYLTGRFLDVK